MVVVIQILPCLLDSTLNATHPIFFKASGLTQTGAGDVVVELSGSAAADFTVGTTTVGFHVEDNTYWCSTPVTGTVANLAKVRYGVTHAPFFGPDISMTVTCDGSTSSPPTPVPAIIINP